MPWRCEVRCYAAKLWLGYGLRAPHHDIQHISTPTIGGHHPPQACETNTGNAPSSSRQVCLQSVRRADQCWGMSMLAKRTARAIRHTGRVVVAPRTAVLLLH
jgi:hypothetical protein